MKIRRLELQGFKSFADRTVFEFCDGVSAIVGPNGCGKSNVVDAIKWVLGDMSPRSLRGKRMEDVIFAGSRSRKSLGLSEVTLVLDNEDGLLPTEHTEVSITRRLHRSGESEYRINGQVARLKDIRELFLDTGLGIDGSSIMEQGQIDALLAANPQDRRGIFEEAAGVSRYKQRRKEADQRLNRTQENLERLRDVLELEEKRHRSLKSQASRARRYAEIREDLSKKRVLRAVLRYRAISCDREVVQTEMHGVLEREAAVAAELDSLEQRVREAEADREAARERVHALEREIAEAAADVRAATDRVAYATQSIDELSERIATAREAARAARERIASIRAEVSDHERSATEAEAEVARQAVLVHEAEAELERLEREAAQIRDAHEGKKRDALNALGRIGEAKNEEAECRAEMRQAEERRARLSERTRDLEVQRERIEAEARELIALAASLEDESRRRAAALEAAEDRRAECLRAADDAGARRAAASEARATKAARLEVLERLAAAHEGVDAGARAILDAVADTAPDGDGARLGVLGLLADLVKPQGELAARLDRLLGHAAGALVVRSRGDALRWIDWLRERGEGERVRFLCLDLARGSGLDVLAARGFGPGALGSLREIEAVVGSVIAGTVLVPDLPSAISEYLERGVNAVTPTGERVTASGALLAGSDARGLGLVERMAEQRALRVDLERLEAEVELARQEATDAGVAVTGCDEEIRRLRAELAHHTEDKSQRGAALARVEKERAHVHQGLEVLASETAELRAFLDEASESGREVGVRVAGLEAERERLEAEAEEAARGYVAIDAARKSASDRRMNVRLGLESARGAVERAKGRLERAHEEIATLEARADEAESEAATLDGRVARARVEMTEAESTARARERVRGEAGDGLVEARATLAALEGANEEVDARRRSLASSHDVLRRELEQVRLREQEFRVRVEALIDQVRQDHDLDLASVAAETAEDEEIDFTAMDAEVESLRSRLEGLGNVNLNAIVELEEAEEHLATLHAQENDLLTGKADLESAIKELDELSTVRFAEAFEAIRVHFRETFRRLFGGGRAEIMLEDASNLLESGIEIVARPPGKEQRTISLLSGGERTLTAVALLFAVFKAKPSPFSVLDEVDAALDEANVRRLVGLIKDFTDRCQFLIVTHAKATMEMADVLYGVTMEEPGVSKKVGVRLTDYPTEVAAAS